MLRWLLPLIAVFALFGQAVTAYAAAGVVGDASCCCPSKETCKCKHDAHDEAPTFKRCNGDAKLVAPAVAVAVAVTCVVVESDQRVAIAPALAPLPLTDIASREPEKPPF